MERKTALVTHERRDFGGSNFDFFTHTSMMRSYKPHEVGVMNARLFSSELGSDMVNKKFTYLTVADNNVYLLPPGVDDYEWYLQGDTDIEFEASELLVSGDATPGKGGIPFSIALNNNWLHEPVYIKTENPDLPLLEIKGYPTMLSLNSYKYTVALQTGDADAFIPVEYLQPGRKFVRVTSFVSDELNYKYAPQQFGEMYKLQSWVSNYANKATFTDKFIRYEIGCRKEKRSMGNMESFTVKGKPYTGGAITKGFVFQSDFRTQENKIVKQGVFVEAVVANLLEQTMMDRELAMEFGKLQKSMDDESGRPKKIAPGWRQIARDGHFRSDNGTLSLSGLYEYISQIFISRKSFSDRKIVICTGEAGMEFLSRLIAQEASQLVVVDSTFVQKRTDGRGVHDNELVFGGQFTKIKFLNGVTVEFVYDPMKDNRKLFPMLAPGTNRTIESYAMDIYDFGMTSQKPADAKSDNITMVAQDGVESFFTVSNVYDFNTGAETTGANVYANNKELGVYNEISGSLGVWDVSRVGRIEFNFVSNTVYAA